MIEAHIAPSRDVPIVAVRIDSGSDRFVIELPVAGAKAGGTPSSLKVRRNNRLVEVTHATGQLRLPRSKTDPGALLEVSVMDRRLSVAIDGVLAFDPVDYENPVAGPGTAVNPIGFGVKNGSLAVSGIKIFRDVYGIGLEIGLHSEAAVRRGCPLQARRRRVLRAGR